MKFGNLKIGIRLALGFALVLALMIAIIVVGSSQMKEINNSLQQITDINNVQVERANNMLDSVHVVTRVIRTIALLNDVPAQNTEKERIVSARESYNENEEQFEKVLPGMLNSEKGRALLEKAKKLKAEARTINDQIVELAMANKKEEAVKLLLEESQPKVTEWRDTLRELNAYASECTAIRAEEAKNSYAKALIMILATGGAAVLLGLLTAFFIARSITGPVASLVNVANVAASGDLTSDIEVKSGDEIGKLATAFKTMVGEMRGLVREIMEKSSALSASSQQLNSSAQQTSAGASENAATMTEIASTVEQVTANVQSISQASEVTKGHANEGSGGLVTINSQMQAIAGTAKEASVAIDGLNTKTQEINQIVDLITSIADQTNLLALNAAIEAARAGEQGRGFAVVAEEVRKLAEQSANATKEISGLVSAIQTESQKAVNNMADGGREVEGGTRVVQEVGQNFQNIISAVQDLSTQIQEVASATEEMSAGVQNVAASTEEQTAAMEEVSASADSLSRLAEEMNLLVGRFKV
ncbi:MAG: hypothetical protein JL50_07230 [Peptococcaceae bacterium BICA1-7]|nr:MAG: hypothetical protein JL50_07230 [Peptococcaceae bacterium BICA1-7]HBV99141.1 methyl-accepting chemotaxis protein [Desulfotomaculum sp.]